MPIVSSGLGSGLDINSLVSQLVAAETEPKLFRIDKKEATIQAEISAFGTIKGNLSDFQSSINNLKDASAFQKRIASSTENSLFTASATTSALEASYDVEILDTATTHKLKSAAFTSIADTVGTGNITIDFGTFDGANFTKNAEKTSLSIDINSGGDSLSAIRDAINQANGGVKANIVNDGTGNRLLLTSTDTGAKHSLKVTVTDDDTNHLDNSGLSRLAYDPEGTLGSGKNLEQSVAAKDASLKIDGIDITSSSNTVTSVIEGVTINVKKADVGNTAKLNITKDSAGIQGKLNTVISNFNTVIKSINDLSGYDADAKRGGLLQGDATIRGIDRQLRNIIGQIDNTIPGDYKSMADIGVKTQSDGTLSLDTTKLQDALSKDFDGIAMLLANGGKTSDPLIRYDEIGSATKPGTYAIQVDSFTPKSTTPATAGIYTAGLLNTTTINGSNNNFTIKIDGVTSNSITIPTSAYSNGDALAAAMEAEINADLALVAGGKSIDVQFVTDHLEFHSTSTGSSSTVEFTAVDAQSLADLGFDVGAGVAGQDEVITEASVSGSIGGVTADSDKDQLQGLGDALGVKVTVLGGSTGARGTVTVSNGVMNKLSDLIDGFLDANEGALELRTTRLNDQVEDLKDQRSRLADRAVKLESRFLKQFTALDTLLGQMRSTSDFLASQLAALPAASQGKSGS